MILNATTKLVKTRGRTKTVEVSVKRRFFRDHNFGIWKPINTLPTDGKTFYPAHRFEITDHELFIGFAPKSSGTPLILITDPKSRAKWALWLKGFGEKPSDLKPKTIGKLSCGVVWEIDGSSELRFLVYGHKIRKLLILKKRPDWNKVTFAVNCVNGILSKAPENERHRILLAKRKGESNPIFWFAKPTAWDSRCARNLNPDCIPETIRQEHKLTNTSSGEWELTITLNPDDLDNAVYPVFVDPTIVLQPDPAEGKEVRLIALLPDKNFGDDQLIAAYHKGTNIQNTVIQFDLSNIPPNSNIISAILYLTQNSNYNGYPHRVLVARTTTSWQESTATWNSPWTNPGGDYSGLYADEGKATYGDSSLETASLVQEWINGKYPNYGYHLRDDIDWQPEYGDSGGVYWSDDYTIATMRPKLTIEYTESGGIFIPAKLNIVGGKAINLIGG